MEECANLLPVVTQACEGFTQMSGGNGEFGRIVGQAAVYIPLLLSAGSVLTKLIPSKSTGLTYGSKNRIY